MSKITISDLAITRNEKSLTDELTEQEINGIFGGKANVEVSITITIKL